MVKVTEGDYLKFKGIDLKIELMNAPSDVRANQPQIFIDRTTEFLYEYMESNFSKQKYEPSNKDEVIKKAILYQMEYFLEHGNLSLYNPDNMRVLSPNAYRVLKNAGLGNGLLLWVEI